MRGGREGGREGGHRALYLEAGLLLLLQGTIVDVFFLVRHPVCRYACAGHGNRLLACLAPLPVCIVMMRARGLLETMG